MANGTYSSARVVSFAGFAPADNPQIACLVIVDEPIDAHGGSTAGPVFSSIMEDSLRYLEVPKDITITKTEPVEEVEVPAMPDNNPMNAIETIKAAGLTPIVETQGEVLYTFVPAEGTKVQKTGNVYLYCGPAGRDAGCDAQSVWPDHQGGRSDSDGNGAQRDYERQRFMYRAEHRTGTTGGKRNSTGRFVQYISTAGECCQPGCRARRAFCSGNGGCSKYHCGIGRYSGQCKHC